MSNYEGDERRTESWHLNKGIPVAFIFVIIMQFAYVVYQEGKTDQRIHNLEATVVAIKSEIAAIRETAITRMEADQHKSAIQIQISAVNTKTDLINSQVNNRFDSLENKLDRQDNKLDRLIERGAPKGQ